MATELLGKKIIGKLTTVGTTARRIPSTGTAPGTDAAESGRQSILIQNLGAAIVYLGDKNVTEGDDGKNIKLAVGGEIPIDAADGCEIYGVTSSGTAKVKTLEGV